MNPKHTLLPLVIALFIFSCSSKQETKVEEEKKKKPNIILFFTDDNSFEYWGFGGGPKLSPNIDKLAEDGLSASQFYCSAAVCTPSRYNLHTGKYAGRCQSPTFLKENPTNEPYTIHWNTMLDSNSEPNLLGKLLQNAGYTTGFVGKWHLGFETFGYGLNADDDPTDPEVDKKLKAMQLDAQNIVKSVGFDYAASVVPENNDYHPVKKLHVHNFDWIAKGAIDYLDQVKDSDEPFFLIVNITTHHGPCHDKSIESDISYTQAGIVEGLEGYLSDRKEIIERAKASDYDDNFHTLVGTAWTDDLVGSILNKLDENGGKENTAVIFTTDHNRYDGKATNYQGGVHIPFLMRYPGVVSAGTTVDQRFQITDLLPTLVTAAGGKVPENIDGINVWPQLTENKENFKRDLYFEFGTSRAILRDDMKYISFRYREDQIDKMKSGEVKEALSYKGKTQDEPCFTRYPHYFAPDQLYNVSTDYQEQNNLISDETQQEKIGELKDALTEILNSFNHPYPSLYEVDPFIQSKEYEDLVSKAKDINMEQYYWYRDECY